MLTYTGIHITKEFGAPSVRDIAVQSMRIVRFSGGGDIFWPIGMHMLLVADLLPPELECHGLLHDAAEIVVSDVPRPMKTEKARALEQRVLRRMYRALGAPALTPEITATVKKADLRAAFAEGVLGCCGRGFAQTQTGFRPDWEAEDALQKYLQQFDPMDALDPDGRWPLLYEDRLRRTLRRAQHGLSYNAEKSTIA